MSSVKVWRYPDGSFSARKPIRANPIPYVAYPEAEAAALEAVAEAAREMVRSDAAGPFSYEAHARLKGSCESLDAARRAS